MVGSSLILSYLLLGSFLRLILGPGATLGHEGHPHGMGPKRGSYLSYRALDRTKSISAMRSSFFVKTETSQNRTHLRVFWAGKPPETSPDPPEPSRNLIPPTVPQGWA